MRIALVHFAVAPVVGGVERIVEEHARLFAAHGHEVVTVALRGTPTVLLPADASAEAHSAVLRPVLAECHVVFIHNVMTMPFQRGLTEALLGLASELSAVRFVAWTHDVAAANPDIVAVAEIFLRAHPCLTYLAVSALRQRQWQELTGTEARVVPNGIDPARVLGLPEPIARLAEEHRLLDGRWLLLQPARLLRRKNIELSFGVMAALRAHGCPATLLVSGAADPHSPGAADYAADLRTERRRLKLEVDVLFVGDVLEVGDAELAGLYRLADALIYPSWQEGFGLPVLEAALHRLPAFFSDLEPLRELGGRHAEYFSPGAEPEVWAGRIGGVLKMSRVASERRRVLRDYAWGTIYEKYLGPLLRELAAKGAH
jgi:glycosyltransferase involved in cell wall biosynthesis